MIDNDGSISYQNMNLIESINLSQYKMDGLEGDANYKMVAILEINGPDL